MTESEGGRDGAQRKTRGEREREGEAVLPLYKVKCAPVPIVCQADMKPWGGRTRGEGGLCHLRDSPAAVKVEEKNRNTEAEVERGEVRVCVCVCVSASACSGSK